MVRTKKQRPHVEAKYVKSQLDVFTLLKAFDPDLAYGKDYVGCNCCLASPCELLQLTANFMLSQSLSQVNPWVMRQALLTLKISVEKHLHEVTEAIREERAEHKEHGSSSVVPPEVPLYDRVTFEAGQQILDAQIAALQVVPPWAVDDTVEKYN
jgi:hypothetical protein